MGSRLLIVLALLLSACNLCGTDYDVVRYNDAGHVVERWENVGDWSTEGGCISFAIGCATTASSPLTVCGDVAVVREGES